MSDKHDCILCDEIGEEYSLSSLLEPSKTNEAKVLAETDALILIPDISPIVPGHCLILTKDHLLNFSKIAERIWNELSQIKIMARELSAKSADSPFFFEHGSNSVSPSSTACIAHAHIHVIPYSINILPSLAEVSLKPPRIGPIDMRLALPTKDCDYLYYEDANSNGCVVVGPHKSLPHQFIRMVVAKQAGIVNWDWTQVFLRNREDLAFVLPNS